MARKTPETAIQRFLARKGFTWTMVRLNPVSPTLSIDLEFPRGLTVDGVDSRFCSSWEEARTVADQALEESRSTPPDEDEPLEEGDRVVCPGCQRGTVDTLLRLDYALVRLDSGLFEAFQRNTLTRVR